MNIDEAVREEIFSLNTLDLVCDKHELDWPIKGWKLNMRKLLEPSGIRTCRDIKYRDIPQQPRRVGTAAAG